MEFGLTLSSGPTVEPLTTAQCKDWLRISQSFTSDDDLIDDMEEAARVLCEERTGRQFVTATWKATFSRFPCQGQFAFGSLQGGGQTTLNQPLNYNFRGDEGRLFLSGWRLPRPPLQAVTTLKYYDTANTQRTLANTVYAVDATRDPGQVFLAPSQVWPAAICGRPDAIEITYTAGHGDTAASVPAIIKQAIRFTLSNWYEKREVGQDLPDAVKCLLDSVWNGCVQYGEIR